jgi:glycosyltransferase involved in cell wall biosynthesis
VYTKLCIIIPCYNEEQFTQAVLDRVRKSPLLYNLQKEIVVMDDALTDNTQKFVDSYIQLYTEISIQYVCHPHNLCKGAFIKTGIKNISGEVVIIQDAYSEYDPNDYNKLLQPICDGYADVVYGSRFMGTGPHRPFLFHTIGNNFLIFLSTLFCNLT